MHAHLFDPYIHRTSPVHRNDSRIKLLLALMFIIGVALLPIGAWAALILFFATSLSAIILSDLSPLRIIRRSVIALPFMLAALPLILTTAGTSFAEFSIGNWAFEATWEGMERVAFLGAKVWVSVQAALLLSATTPFPDLLLAMRALRFPQLIVAVIGLMWRYLFVLADEAIRLMRAREARSGADPDRRSGGSISWRARVTGGMAGSLILRGFDRADRIYAAMLARGYDGEIRGLPVPQKTRRDYAVLAAGAVWIFVLSMLGIFIR